MIELFKIELEMELPKKDYKKRIIGVIGLIVFAYTIMIDTIKINQTTLLSIITSISLITLFTSISHMMSKLRGKYINIWYALPVNRTFYFIIINAVSYIKHFLLKVVPFLLAFLYIGLIHKDISISGTILCFIILMIMSMLFSIIGGVCALVINNVNDRSKGSRRSYRFNFNTFFAKWFQREYHNFINNKLFFLNHFLYGFFSLFIICNMCKNIYGFKGISLFMLFFIHLSSTATLTFSKEKNVWSLMNSLPINKKKIFIVKYIFNMIILVPIYVVAVFVMSKITSISLINLTVSILFTGLITTFIKVYIDYKLPILNWQHERQMFDSKRKYSVWIKVLIINMPNLLIGQLNITIIMLIQIIIASILIYMYSKNKKIESE